MDKPVLGIVFFIVISGVAYYLWQEREADLLMSQESREITKLSIHVSKKNIDQAHRENPEAESYSIVAEEGSGEASVPAIDKTIPLPDIDSSDDSFREELGRLYGPLKSVEIFIFNDFARHVVVSTDNLTAKKLPQRFSFTKKPEKVFSVNKSGDESKFKIDENNYKRYAKFIEFANTVSIGDMLFVYLRYYPLFQQAYEELGYPEANFNNRLIEVINHLLQTPVIYGEISLIQPKVFYQFADPTLENLSAGQKLLIRSGPENTLQIKSCLKKLQFALSSLKI
jgi:hypothetical protein